MGGHDAEAALLEQAGGEKGLGLILPIATCKHVFLVREKQGTHRTKEFEVALSKASSRVSIAGCKYKFILPWDLDLAGGSSRRFRIDLATCAPQPLVDHGGSASHRLGLGAASG